MIVLARFHSIPMFGRKVITVNTFGTLIETTFSQNTKSGTYLVLILNPSIIIKKTVKQQLLFAHTVSPDTIQHVQP